MRRGASARRDEPFGARDSRFGCRTADRDRVIAALVNSPVRNAVVLTGDVHSHWAADVLERFDDPSSRVVATELVATSITSGGDGSDFLEQLSEVLPAKPTEWRACRPYERREHGCWRRSSRLAYDMRAFGAETPRRARLRAPKLNRVTGRAG